MLFKIDAKYNRFYSPCNPNVREKSIVEKRAAFLITFRQGDRMKKMIILCTFLTYTALCMEVPATQPKHIRSGKRKTVFFERRTARYNSSNSDYVLQISFDPENKTIIGSFISLNPKKRGVSYTLTLEKRLEESGMGKETLYKGINVTTEEAPSEHKVKLLTDKMHAFEKKQLQKMNRNNRR